ncbi:hypothetical protein GGR55DRAFT_105131 [Xylaria sp. FL0064]|nr:hypothetical protein GGR55DRAFT_105131 [Xylaria sp. FL0064]
MLSTSIWFLDDLDLYKEVKPYRLAFEPEDESFPQTNVKRVEINNVPIRDIREHQDRLQFPKCGFGLLDIPSHLTSLDFDNPELVSSQYYPLIEKLVQQFSARYHRNVEVIALDHKVRKRHSAFPISHGKNYPNPQAVMVAHVDWTPESIEKKLRSVVGDEKTETILSGQFQFCHAWRPLLGPLRDYPLAVCDYSTVDPEADYEPCDDVHEIHGTDENYMVYHRSSHQWYVLLDQIVTEVLLFRQYDSTIGRRSGIPHCAIPNPIPSPGSVPRESIEVELIVFWKGV